MTDPGWWHRWRWRLPCGPLIATWFGYFHCTVCRRPIYGWQRWSVDSDPMPVPLDADERERMLIAEYMPRIVRAFRHRRCPSPGPRP